jgi:hypothetical protein
MNDNEVVWATIGNNYLFIYSWINLLCITSDQKITIGGLFLFVRMNFAKKMDDHVVYFKTFYYIC